jgi:serine protease AprX
VVSGVAALLAQKYPAATPDQIKGLIDGAATTLPDASASTTLTKLASTFNLTVDQYVAMVNSANAYYSGNGVVNAVGAAAGNPKDYPAQEFPAATGTGTLEGARGGVYVSDNGVNLTGEQDIFGQPFNAAKMATAQAAAGAWTGGVWNGSRWSGDSWTGNRWAAASWTGNDWAGSRWTGSRWTSMAWDGSRWSGTGWSGSRWTGTTWDGSRWSSATWN